MNLSIVEIRKLKEAAYLHDIGKVVLDNNLLNKRDNLTDNEQKEINQHPITGHRILNSFDSTLDLAEIVLAHHERWDGLGYPKGLKGNEIPLLARIIAVAEYYDLLSNKHNNRAKTHEEAINALKKYSGSKFDPSIVGF